MSDCIAQRLKHHILYLSAWNLEHGYDEVSKAPDEEGVWSTPKPPGMLIWSKLREQNDIESTATRRVSSLTENFSHGGRFIFEELMEYYSASKKVKVAKTTRLMP